MKKILFILGLCFIGLVACEESITELNTDPDTSPTARNQELLTAAQGSTAWNVGLQLNQIGMLWGQYWTWGPGVSLGDRERYVQVADDYDNLWNHAYTVILNNLNTIIKTGDVEFAGVAKLMKAYNAQLLVDMFGRIPYTDAVKGEIDDGNILTPAYDSGQDVYNDLLALVDEAVIDLAAASGSVGSEDLIYGGNLALWEKFANSLKLKLLMRQAESGSVAGEVQTLIGLGNFIETNAEMAAIGFDGTAGDENPMYARFEAGVGFFYVASNTTLDWLTNTADPRLPFLFNEAVNSGSYVGIDQGDVDSVPFTDTSEDYSQGTALTYSNTNPVILMSAWEVWFLRAEAAARFGTADDEEVALQTAIQTNFDYMGAGSSATHYGALGYNAAGSLNDKLEIIGIEKWISMNGLQQAEGWIETRRFDTPSNPVFNSIFATPPLSVLATGVHPSIFYFPETEVARNPNTPAQNNSTDKVFWDN